MPDFIMACIHGELHLKYHVLFWSPRLGKAIVKVEKIQKKGDEDNHSYRRAFVQKNSRLSLWEKQSLRE